MEMYIQFRSTLFSFGSKGFRRIETWDWKDVAEKFELLFEAQHASVQKMDKGLKSAEKEMRAGVKHEVIMKNQGAWASFNDNTLPMPDVDAQFDMEDGK